MASDSAKIAMHSDELESWLGFGIALVHYAQKDVEAFVAFTNEMLEENGQKGGVTNGEASLNLANYKDMLFQMGDRIKVAKAASLLHRYIYGD